MAASSIPAVASRTTEARSKGRMLWNNRLRNKERGISPPQCKWLQATPACERDRWRYRDYGCFGCGRVISLKNAYGSYHLWIKWQTANRRSCSADALVVGFARYARPDRDQVWMR